MAGTDYAYAKRQRDIARKKKKQEKLKLKAEMRQQAAGDMSEDAQPESVAEAASE